MALFGRVFFSVEECAARRECKVQPAIRGYYAGGGEHQIYDASPGQFAQVIADDSPLFPVLRSEGLCGGIRAARLISPQWGAAATPEPTVYIVIGDGAYRDHRDFPHRDRQADAQPGAARHGLSQALRTAAPLRASRGRDRGF